MSFVETWDETKPAGSRDLSLGDDDIREFKRALRERLALDHIFDDDEVGFTTIGYHYKATLVKQASNPTAVNDAGILYSKDAGSDKIELYYIDDDSQVTQFTNAGKLRAESIGGVYAAANVAALASIMNFVYPVGSVVTLGVSTNPNTLFGVGTWTAITGKVIVGISGSDTEFDSLDETGGAKTASNAHTHTGTTVIAGGYASAGGANVLSGGGFDISGGNTLVSPQTFTTDSGGGSISTLQPYIVKYVWQRTA